MDFAFTVKFIGISLVKQGFFIFLKRGSAISTRSFSFKKQLYLSGSTVTMLDFLKAFLSMFVLFVNSFRKK